VCFVMKFVVIFTISPFLFRARYQKKKKNWLCLKTCVCSYKHLFRVISWCVLLWNLMQSLPYLSPFSLLITKRKNASVSKHLRVVMKFFSCNKLVCFVMKVSLIFTISPLLFQAHFQKKKNACVLRHLLVGMKHLVSVIS